VKRIVVMWLMVLSGVGCPRLWAADEAGLDDLRRQALAAEDLRFERTRELARLHSRLGRLEEARHLYEEALRLWSADTEVAEELLGVLRQLGDDEALLRVCRQLVSRRPLDAVLQMQMGECLWRLGRTDEARRTWDDLLKRFPAERAVYDDLIDFYIAEEHPADARVVLARRRERFAEDARLLLTEARLALAEGKPADALSRLYRCLQQDLAEEDARRAEILLLSIAHETGRTDEVARKLTDDLERIDARLAGRLLELADEAAGRGGFREAVGLARRALPLLENPAKQAEVTALIAAWQAKARMPRR